MKINTENEVRSCAEFLANSSCSLLRIWLRGSQAMRIRPLTMAAHAGTGGNAADFRVLQDAADWFAFLASGKVTSRDQ